jgi:hypothetical protein
VSLEDGRSFPRARPVGTPASGGCGLCRFEVAASGWAKGAAALIELNRGGRGGARLTLARLLCCVGRCALDKGKGRGGRTIWRGVGARFVARTRARPARLGRCRRGQQTGQRGRRVQSGTRRPSSICEGTKPTKQRCEVLRAL